jgi:hypothetical protein
MPSTRKPDPSDVRDDEWTFVVPYLALLPEDVSIGQTFYDRDGGPC